MQLTAGCKALRAWLEGKNRSQMALAALLDISQAAISQWVKGGSRPTDHHRKLLELHCGIPVAAWRTKREQASIEAAEKAAAGAVA